MKPLSAFPQGVNSALELQLQGIGVFQGLEENLVGVFETRDLYLLNRRRDRVFNSVNAAIGGQVLGADAFVPVGELWYVWHYFVRADCDAGESITLQAALNYTQLLSIPLGYPVSAAALGQVRAISDGPFWAPPGAQFGYIGNALTGVVGLVGGIVYTPLRV